MLPLKLRTIILVSHLMILSGGYVFSNTILNAKSRTEQLTQSERVIEITKTDFLNYAQDLKIPFIYIKIESDEAVAPKTVFSDSEVLAAISTSYLPHGRVYKDGKYYLIFKSGIKSDHDSFTTKFIDKDYSIIIEDVTPSGYILRLNDATIEMDFSDVERLRTFKSKKPQFIPEKI